VLKQLKPGITMVIVHCSRPTDEFPLITASSGLRFEDLKAMTDSGFAQDHPGGGHHPDDLAELLQRREKLGSTGPPENKLVRINQTH